MARLVSLAAARAQPFRPALRPLLQSFPLQRLGVGAAIAVVAFALAYVGARETSMFAVRDVAVTGAPAPVNRAVQAALADLEGVSLIELSAAEVEDRLRAIPSVLAASVDRGFPHTLRVEIVPERPLAVVKHRQTKWTVSRRGRVIAASEGALKAGLPLVVTPTAEALAPGNFIADTATLISLQALGQVPADFSVGIRSAAGDESGVMLLLADDIELRLGSIDDLPLKLAAADAVFESLSRLERAELAYLDVSVPQRAVAATKYQVSIDG
jgi:cell division protein FtsQ